MGAPEYWIVGYLGIGDGDYIGKPKQPTIAICTFVEEEHQRGLFRGSDPCGICKAARLLSLTFLDL
ncbi:MAG: hypothetical protein LH702_01815 [Phormidesmis sp. CAN_BIN44]|nr:hypothetical protein [Phormidesmis sp. CAN_BIN44]